MQSWFVLMNPSEDHSENCETHPCCSNCQTLVAGSPAGALQPWQAFLSFWLITSTSAELLKTRAENATLPPALAHA
jgi:hypothetical protein